MRVLFNRPEVLDQAALSRIIPGALVRVDTGALTAQQRRDLVVLFRASPMLLRRLPALEAEVLRDAAAATVTPPPSAPPVVATDAPKAATAAAVAAASSFRRPAHFAAPAAAATATVTPRAPAAPVVVDAPKATATATPPPRPATSSPKKPAESTGPPKAAPTAKVAPTAEVVPAPPAPSVVTGSPTSTATGTVTAAPPPRPATRSPTTRAGGPAKTAARDEVPPPATAPNPALLPAHLIEQDVLPGGATFFVKATGQRQVLTAGVVVNVTAWGTEVDRPRVRGGVTFEVEGGGHGGFDRDEPVVPGLPETRAKVAGRLFTHAAVLTEATPKQPARLAVCWAPLDAVPLKLDVDLFTYATTEYFVPVGTLTKGTARYSEAAPPFAWAVGEPKPEDVKQSDLGDCYLQAVLISIAKQDPAHLRSIMTPALANGVNVVDVVLHHQSEASTAFTPETVRVATTLPTSAAGEPLYHAGSTWVRLMQKAFAAFATKHGQYGIAYAKPADAPPEGYARIGNSGVSHEVYKVLYGPRVESDDRMEMTYTRAVAGRAAILDAIKALMATAASAPGGKRTFTSASTSASSQMDRAAAEATALPTPRGQPVEKFLELVAAVQLERTGPPPEPAKTKPQAEALAGVAGVRAQAGKVVTLLQGNRDPAVVGLRELCLGLMQSGDTSTGAKFVYGKHAYTVIDVTIKNLGSAAPHTAELRQTDLALIDFDASKVTLRNPHRDNVPDGLAVKGKPGLFELTLDQFLRSFNQLDVALVKPA
jgi:hypothetical protein